MNYLFVGMAECTRRTESKKREKGKGRKELRWRRRRRRNTYRRILQRLLDAFVLLRLNGEFSSQRRKRKRKTERKKEREGGKGEKGRRRGSLFLVSSSASRP